MPAYFSEASLKFLNGLKKHNDRDWFNARKEVYETQLKTPLLDFVGAATAAMESFAADFQRPPEKCVMRIYRDIRFSANKDPYKTHVAAWWARRGMEKTSGGGYYFQFGPDGITIAAGCYMPGKDQLLAIRRMLVNDYAEMRKALKVKEMEPFEGMPLSRAPKGFPADHPALDLICQRQWGVSAHLAPEVALTDRLLTETVRRFKAASPLVNLLNQAISGAAKPAKGM